MSKKIYLAIVGVFTTIFVLPPLAYVIVNFYTYLFNGWTLNEKFSHALGWLIAMSVVYAVLMIVWAENASKWRK